MDVPTPEKGFCASLRTGIAAMLLLGTITAAAATLPAHRPFSLLIIADEVNPHRLSAAELTQPEDLQPALSSTDSSLNLAGISTVDSQCADAAVAALESSSPPDVVLYFAHRHATDCAGNSVQERLTEALAAGLADGRSLVVLHHGLYDDVYARGTKLGLLELIGAQADSIAWDTVAGQRVYNVARDHFITTNGLSYPQEANFAGTAGVQPGSYPWFTNVPDELYVKTLIHTQVGETRTPLFASDSGEARLLGYVLQRAGWTGRVIVYQPAEYQPNALDDREGPNFQILVNMLYFAAQP